MLPLGDASGPTSHNEERAASGDARLTAPDPGAAKQTWGDDRIAARQPSAAHSSAAARGAALQVPSKDELEAIARRQDAKREAMQAAKSQGQRDEEEAAAAALIQRNYRGYKQRRELAGMGLDASTRWVEVRETLSLKIAPLPSSSTSTLPISPFALRPLQCDRLKQTSIS